MTDKEILEKYGYGYEGLWDYSFDYGRSDAMYKSYVFGISRASAYEELYGESYYDYD